MNKSKYLIILLGLIFSSCTNEQNATDCITYKHAFITKVESESLNVKKGFDLPIKLSYKLDNSCGDFYNFEVTRDNNVFDIKIKTKYEGCECNDIVNESITNYYFRSVEEGIYTLKFYSSSSEFTTLLINVE